MFRVEDVANRERGQALRLVANREIGAVLRCVEIVSQVGRKKFEFEYDNRTVKLIAHSSPKAPPGFSQSKKHHLHWLIGSTNKGQPWGVARIDELSDMSKRKFKSQSERKTFVRLIVEAMFVYGSHADGDKYDADRDITVEFENVIYFRDGSGMIVADRSFETEEAPTVWKHARETIVLLLLGAILVGAIWLRLS